MPAGLPSPSAVVGMRVSVSSKELAAIERAPNDVMGAGGAAAAGSISEAYPASESRAEAKKAR